MIQLSRLELGDDIEESHMRNRQLVAKWAFEHGEKDKVIERVEREGKTYFVIRDYDKLRALFGDLLRESGYYTITSRKTFSLKQSKKTCLT